MKKQFILGMLVPPVLLLLYTMGKSLIFHPPMGEDDFEQYKLGISYEDATTKEEFSPSIFMVKKGESFEESNAQSLKGKPSILHIWATWCGPCAHEMPSFVKFVKKNGGKYNILAVSVDTAKTVEEAYNAVQKHLKEKGWSGLNLAYDHTARFTNDVKASGVPTTIFLNAQGVEIGRVNGGMMWDDKEVEQLLDSIFQVK